MLSTWSMKVQHSFIMKYGTMSDQRCFLPEQRQNKKQKQVSCMVGEGVAKKRRQKQVLMQNILTETV